MSKAPPAKKIDLSALKIPPWAKPGKPIWVEIVEGPENTVMDYLQGTIDEIFEDKKLYTILYESGTGEKEVLCNRVYERSEDPKSLEDLVDIEPLNDAELLR